MKLTFIVIALTILFVLHCCESASPAPSRKPSKAPTAPPSLIPTNRPTTRPTGPSLAPTRKPTAYPTASPTNPTAAPTIRPTREPSTARPSNPSVQPTASTLSPTSLPASTVMVSFPFTGYPQNFTVPAGVTELTVTLIGASGHNASFAGRTDRGGRGALITSVVPVSPGEVYRIYCGGSGGKGNDPNAPGYNGGGAGKGLTTYTAAGGGGTDFRAFPYSIDDRMVVAGGGGGAGGNCPSEGGDGGWPIGLSGENCAGVPHPTGGTQESGGFSSSGYGPYEEAANRGSFFYGGEGVDQPTGNLYGYGGGGGGGYYGGGGAYAIGGAGGSSYSNYPILEATNGTWTGNGHAWITYTVGATDPTTAPTVPPTATPSTAAPSAVPSKDPSAVPSLHPTAIPSTNPSAAPSLNPTAGPTYTVTAPIPTAPPSLAPSAVPTLVPSAKPSVSPTVKPSAVPTLMPSANPTASPTVDPSAAPTLVPTTNPTVAPTSAPTAIPSHAPTAAPTCAPTVAPTAVPSFAPTAAPSCAPTVAPTAVPSFAPTAAPTCAPTVAPTAVPSARPTLATVQPYEVLLGVEQDVYFMTMEAYVSQKAQCNHTIQHTVAASLDGVIPERVTDIEVGETEAARSGNMRALATTDIPPPVSLKYKVRVFDPVLSAEVLTKQLITKVKSGDMDQTFRAFAAIFNATRLENGTFTEPKITVLNEAYQGDPATSGEIAGIVLGGFLFVVLLTFGVWLFVRWLKKDEEESETEQTVQPGSAASVSAV